MCCVSFFVVFLFCLFFCLRGVRGFCFLHVWGGFEMFGVHGFMVVLREFLVVGGGFVVAVCLLLPLFPKAT